MDTNAIQNEVAKLSDQDLVAALQKLAEQNAKRKESYSTPEAKARRKEWYEARKNDPEYKAKRKEQADQRKAQMNALLQLAKDRGIDIKSLGF